MYPIYPFDLLYKCRTKNKCHKLTCIYVSICEGADKLKRQKIYAKDLFRERDFYHLAKEFYRYIFRYPELESDAEWSELKQYAEDLIVAIKFKRDPETEMSKSEFRDFLRFYTKLEMKFYDEEKEFIFTETEKTLFLALRPKTRIS